MDAEIDRIPFIGVDFVKAHFELAGMQIDSHDGASQSLPEDYFCWQIATNSEGYNSGRTYTLRTNSKSQYDDILPLMKRLVKVSKRRAQATTFFRKCQWRVRKIYAHNMCQAIVAVIIMGVSLPLPILQRPAYPLPFAHQPRPAPRAPPPRRASRAPSSSPSSTTTARTRTWARCWTGSTSSSPSSSRSSSSSAPSPTGSPTFSSTPGPGSTPLW